MLARIRYSKLELRLAMYLVAVLSFLAAVGIRFHLGLFATNEYDIRQYIFGLALYTVVWAIVTERLRLTDPVTLAALPSAISRIASGVAITSAVQFAVLFFAKNVPISRVLFAVMVLFTAALAMIAVVLFRSDARRLAVHTPIRVLMVGADRFAARAASQLRSSILPACVIVGHLPLARQLIEVGDAPIYTAAEIMAGEIGFDEIVVASGPECLSAGAVAIRKFRRLSRPLRAIIDLGDRSALEKAFTLGNLQVFNIGSLHPESLRYLVLKRAFDLAFSIAVLIGFSPLFLIIWAAIKLTSPGPALFKQQRVGLNGDLFEMYKFRTMRVAPTSESDTKWTTAEDRRRTRLGRFLRKTSLDELPQFLNVLKGDMSVVGPRPERPYFVGKFLDEIADYNIRHRLKVGITGWAQVNGWRGDTSIEQRIEHDLFYLNNWSFALDLWIVAKTPWAGLVHKNAY